jgi:hypothetical protein
MFPVQKGAQMNDEKFDWDLSGLFLVAGLLIGIVLALVCFPCPASALLVSDIIITPNTTVMAGDTVSASFSIDLTQYDRYTMNPDNSLKFSTDLSNPSWINSFILQSVRGVKIPQTGNSFDLPGWQLAYPLGTSEHIDITLSGAAPSLNLSQQTKVFSVAEYDKMGNVIPGSISTFRLLTINPGDLSWIIAQEEKDLQDLKSDIIAANEISTDGSTAAGTLYKQAEMGIAYLKTLKPSEYEKGVSRAREVDTDILQAEGMLHRAAIQKQINRATIPINQTAMILGWFAKDTRTANYPGLSNVNEQYQYSLALLTDASSQMNNAQWAMAGTNAEQAYIIGNRTFSAAIILQKRAGDPLTPLWDNTWVMYVVIGAGVVYLLFFRKKKRKVKKIDNAPAGQKQDDEPQQAPGVEPDPETSTYESSTATEDEPLTEADCMNCEKDCPELVKTRRQLSRKPCPEKVTKSDHSDEEETNILYDSVR